MKTIATIVGVVVLIGIGFVFLYHPATQPTVGAAAGPDVSFHTFFHDNVTVGGFDYATSSAGASTYSATPFVNAKVIEQQAPSTLTVTLPTNAALSSAGFLPNIGDTDTKFIHASTTLVTLAGNTGVTLSTASSTKAISANSTGILSCVRLGATEGRLIQCILLAD